MAYITEADFRPGSEAEYAVGYTLTTTDASNSNLTATIARMSQRFDELCNDHFETETGETVYLDGSGHRKLLIPRRCTAITTLSIRDQDGTYNAQTNTNSNTYHLHSSLFDGGSRKVADLDYVELLPYGTGITVALPPYSSPWYWPRGSQAVKIEGTFGWTVTPHDVKRAVTLMVWNSYKQIRGSLGQVVRQSTADATTEFLVPDPANGIYTGILEVDQIVQEYRRETYGVA